MQHVNAGAWLGVVVCVVLQVCGSRGPGDATTVKPGHQEKPDSLIPAQCRGDGAAAQAPPTIAGGWRPGAVDYAPGTDERQSPVPPATSHRETDLRPVLALGPGLRRHAQGNHPVRRRPRCGALSHWQLSMYHQAPLPTGGIKGGLAPLASTLYSCAACNTGVCLPLRE